MVVVEAVAAEEAAKAAGDSVAAVAVDVVDVVDVVDAVVDVVDVVDADDDDDVVVVVVVVVAVAVVVVAAAAASAAAVAMLLQSAAEALSSTAPAKPAATLAFPAHANAPDSRSTVSVVAQDPWHFVEAGALPLSGRDLGRGHSPTHRRRRTAVAQAAHGPLTSATPALSLARICKFSSCRRSTWRSLSG